MFWRINLKGPLNWQQASNQASHSHRKCDPSSSNYAALCYSSIHPCPSLTFVDGSQNGRVTDDVLPPSIPLRLIAAMRRSAHPVRPPLSSLMKYRLVFVGGKGRSSILSPGWFSDVPVPSHNFTNWVRGGKEKRWVGWLSCSFHCSIAFFGSGGDGEGGKKEEREEEGGCIDQPEEWRGRGGREGGRQEKAVGLINTLRRHGDRVVWWLRHFDSNSDSGHFVKSLTRSSIWTLLAPKISH